MIYGATNNPMQPIVEEIRALAPLGFDYLELCLDPPLSSPERIRADKKEILAALDGEGMRLVVGHLPTFVWLADVYESVREASLGEIKTALDLLAELNVGKAVVHPGYITGLLRFDPKTGINYSTKSLEIVIEDAEKCGVTLCYENMFPRSGHMYRPQEMAEVLEAHPSLMMTLDMGHAAIGAPPSRLPDMIDAGKNRIRHVHASDNTGRDDDHLPIGVGRVDVKGALAKLKAAGYDATMTLEVFSPDRDYLALSLNKVKTMWEAI